MQRSWPASVQGNSEQRCVAAGALVREGGGRQEGACGWRQRGTINRDSPAPARGCWAGRQAPAHVGDRPLSCLSDGHKVQVGWVAALRLQLASQARPQDGIPVVAQAGARAHSV